MERNATPQLPHFYRTVSGLECWLLLPLGLVLEFKAFCKSGPSLHSREASRFIFRVKQEWKPTDRQQW